MTAARWRERWHELRYDTVTTVCGKRAPDAAVRRNVMATCRKCERVRLSGGLEAWRRPPLYRETAPSPERGSNPPPRSPEGHRALPTELPGNGAAADSLNTLSLSTFRQRESVDAFEPFGPPEHDDTLEAPLTEFRRVAAVVIDRYHDALRRLA